MDHEAFAKQVHEVVYDTYRRIKNGGKPQSHEWTVLASILAEKEGKLEVIALATGTKCVGEAQMSEKGLVVNDCHAEVLCRRAFLFFLMREMAQFRSTGKSAYLEETEDSDKLQMKASIRLHLYVSQTPCGFASEYAKKDGKREAVERFVMKQRKSKRVRLDVGIEDVGDFCEDHGEEDMHLSGAKFVDDNVRLSTKPGRGEPSRSYSCSDKICLWSLLGLQGAALSLLLRPVYLASIVISGEMDEAVASRALSSRVVIPVMVRPVVQGVQGVQTTQDLQTTQTTQSSQSSQDMQDLLTTQERQITQKRQITQELQSSPFTQHHPTIIHDTLPSPLCEREVMKTLEGKRLAASGAALVWVKPDVQEALIARSGVKLGTNVKKGVTEKNMSVVSPLALFRQFKALCALGGSCGVESDDDYDTVKQRAVEYGRAKERAMDPSLPCSLKAWRRKDRRFYHFQCSVCNKHAIRRS
ncbi:hypothetical protein BLSTO_02367 [Blastocystis sp. subtype 1]